ncbi:MAG: hypothetical protein KC544_05505 [Gemmatimonadetes bacterium]|nr:hypothetical protein [Gemmatimonadota bacterium]
MPPARLLVALVLVTTPLAAQWQPGAELPLVARAATVRSVRDSGAALGGWQATAEGVVRFALVVTHEGMPIERVVRADELRVEVYGEAPNRSKQQIVAWRDTTYFPNRLRYHRDHLGIVASDFGPIIRLGDGDEVRDVPHPLSPRGLTHYRFRPGDTVRVAGPTGEVRVVAVDVRPADPAALGTVGTLYLDADRGALVRFAFTFTAPSYRDATVETITVQLENALIDGRLWLPWRQSIAIRRADPRLGLPLGSVLRASWEIGDYRIGVQHPDSTFRGASIAGLAGPGIDAWDRPMAATLETRPLTDADLDAVQSAARELLVGGRLSGLPDLRLLGARGLSSFLSVDRVQGVRVGAGVDLRLHGDARLGLDLGIGTSGGLVTGGIGYHPTGRDVGWRVTFDRRVVDLDDAPRISGLVNSVATVLDGDDQGDWRSRTRLLLGHRLQLGAVYLDAALAAERHRTLVSRFTALDGTRRRNPALGYGDVATLRVEAGQGDVERGWQVSAEHGVGDATWSRAAARLATPLPLGAHLAVRGGLGSPGLPAGRSFALGGRGTLPGAADRAFGGRQLVLVRLERPVTVRLPAPGMPTGLRSVSLVREVAPFVAVGWAGGAVEGAPWQPSLDPVTVLGLRVDLGGPLARIELGWAPRAGSIRLLLDAHPTWWPIL